MSDHRIPAADGFAALELAGGSRWLRRVSRLLTGSMAVLALVLLGMPWRQNLPGTGRVIEFDPIHRPMPIQARTDGLVLQWHVREGQRVAAGDPIVDLADNDPYILERLRDQLAAAAQKRTAAENKRAAYVQQLAEAQSAREAAIAMADDDVIAAEQAVKSAAQAIQVSEATVRQNEFLETMFVGLIEDKIAPGFELERARQQASVARADLLAKQAQLEAIEAALRARRSARLRVERDEQVKVHSVEAQLQSAEGEIAEAAGSILRLERDLERQRQQSLTAPVAGTIQRLLANGQGGGFVKSGETLAMLVPDSEQRAVELLVDGNDVTFIEIGSHVRLQFEGWPAVQFVGWPSAAVGTFGGKVAFVDPFESGQGQFRIMVLPDEQPFPEEEGFVARGLRSVLTFDPDGPDRNPHAWPAVNFLRQGVRAKGWVMLREVPLWFEIWRRFNGFPPSLKAPLEGLPESSGKPKSSDGSKAGDDDEKK